MFSSDSELGDGESDGELGDDVADGEAGIGEECADDEPVNGTSNFPEVTEVKIEANELEIPVVAEEEQVELQPDSDEEIEEII